MATITTDQIKKLRDETGISVMQCKKALEEAGGDMGKALVLLRKRSKEIATKKALRTLGAGAIQCYVHGAGSVGAMVELACETDFVSKNSEFKTLAYDIAMQIAATDPEFLRRSDVSAEKEEAVREAFKGEVEGKPEAIKNQILEGKAGAYWSDKILLDQPFIKNQELTITALIEGAIQKFGEKIEVVRFARFAVGK